MHPTVCLEKIFRHIDGYNSVNMQRMYIHSQLTFFSKMSFFSRTDMLDLQAKRQLIKDSCISMYILNCPITHLGLCCEIEDTNHMIRSKQLFQ